VSLDQLFDLLFVVVFIVLPVTLTAGGLVVAIRSKPLAWSLVGLSLALVGTWIGFMASVYVARCPSQACEQDTGAVGDGTLGAIALAIVYVLIVAVVRHRKTARSPNQTSS
jgi:hypothetical protein